MKYLGVDCGIHGGLAILEINDNAAPQLLAAIGVPTIGVKAKERVNAIALQEHDLLARRKDHSRAESILIALFGSARAGRVAA